MSSCYSSLFEYIIVLIVLDSRFLLDECSNSSWFLELIPLAASFSIFIQFSLALSITSLFICLFSSGRLFSSIMILSSISLLYFSQSALL